jgi:hypothetical protein
MIPKEAAKPVDGRTKAGRAFANEDMPMPRKTPFLYMTDLYHTPGTADRVGESLLYNHEAQALVDKLQAHITENYYTCTDEILAGLGKMYVADERFKKNIDKYGEGTAEFAAEAIVVFCQNK